MLITAIAQLGQALSKESDIGALVDQTDAKNVVVLKFTIRGSKAKYRGIEIEEKKDDKLYLYRRDLAGRGTGLFLTGRITRFDLQTLQRNLTLLEKNKDKKAQEMINDFLKKKLDWLPRGGIVTDSDLLSNLNQRSRTILLSIIDGIVKSSEQIHKDFLKKVRKLEPEELLLTLKLKEGSRERYIGEFPEYISIFRQAVTRVRKKDKTIEILDLPKCTICNKTAVTGKFSQPPLPFVTTDKPGFIPSGEKNEAYKVFPLCSDCYLDLRRGMIFIKNNLDFSISSIEGRRAEVRFWLVPIIGNPELAMSFIKDLGKSATKSEKKKSMRYLYLRNLKDMCYFMKAITVFGFDNDIEAAEAYLSFTAIFYAKDSKGHMRLISRAEGIYPRRLRFITQVKKEVDSLPLIEKSGVRFGFPLLREFLAAPKSEGWYKDLASTLGKIFTAESVEKSLIYKAITKKIQEIAKETDLKKITDASIRALSLIEYIEYLELSDSEEKFMNSQEKYGKYDQISQIKQFMDAHKGLFRDDTLRAVCATGIATGILLEVQRKRSRGQSMPFWGRLNRLEMDLERVRQLFPEIMSKLNQYGVSRHDNLLAYLGSAEIAKLDWSRKDLPNDVISLAFAVGMAQGYWTIRDGGGD